jgi:hypothetical protein
MKRDGPYCKAAMDYLVGNGDVLSNFGPEALPAFLAGHAQK